MKKITIGSSPACTLCIDDPNVANVHCTIKEEYNGLLTVKNFGVGGTWVDGEKVDGKKTFGCIGEVRIENAIFTWEEIKNASESSPSMVPFSSPELDEVNQEMQKGDKDESVLKERNGFVTFWLWLGIIVNLIMIPVDIIAYGAMRNPRGEYLMGQVLVGQDINPAMESLHRHLTIIQIVVAIKGLCLAFFYVKILRWKKVGFWGMACTAIVVNIVNIIVMKAVAQDYQDLGLGMIVNNTFAIVVCLISIVSLWAILQIRKNGISCWKQLE